MAELVNQWATGPMQDRIRRRHRTDRLVRGLGLSALLLVAGFLGVLLVSILAGGLSAFRETQVRVPVTFDAARLGVDETLARSDPRALVHANFQGVLADAVEQAHGPDVQLVSDGAWVKLRRDVEADPALIGTTQEVWLTAETGIDQLAKGRIDPAAPVADRAVSDADVAVWQQLKEADRARAVLNLHFLTGADSVDPELAGIWGAVKGSLLTLIVTLGLSVPVGVLAAIYLEEFAGRSRWTGMIEVSISNLAAVPSILFGLLGLAVFLNSFNMPRSAPIVGGLTLALMTMPIIVISSRAALARVPGDIRTAARGIGASPLQVVLHHVLPLALPGILTGTILAVARALGEAAPMLLIGMRAFLTAAPGGFAQPATVLPVQVFLWSDKVSSGFIEKTSGAIIVLLLLVMLVNGAAIVLRDRLEARR